ncbi:MAG: hypothetical protein LBS43_08500 [Prevotellaceae bacterium]|jgi:hypothetical protein|nr:hypothetical protein [Prevotellaceae bacterium]
MNSSRTKKSKTCGIKILFLLLALFAGSCGKSNEPVDINGKDITSIVAEDVTKLLTAFPWKGKIIEYELSAVQTPESLFLEIAGKQIAENVVLHPNLTYRIKYRKWNFKTDQCDAMAYSIVREGKLYGDGVVLTQSVNWTNIIGYRETFGVNTFWILLLTLLFSIIVFRLYAKIKFDHKAKIVRVDCVKSGFGGFTLSSFESGRSAYIGHLLRVAVGTNVPMHPLPSSVEIRFAYVNSNGNGELAGGSTELRGDSPFIRTGEIFFPSKPYLKEFICKAWVFTAYYANGEIWTNRYAKEEEEKAKRFIAKKLKRI